MHAKVYFAGWSTFYTGGPNSIIATDGSIVYERFVPHGQNKFDRSIFYVTGLGPMAMHAQLTFGMCLGGLT